MVKTLALLSAFMLKTQQSNETNDHGDDSRQQRESSPPGETSASFGEYYQATFHRKLDALNGVKRFNERYRIKGHLGAGAHGLILWATDRVPSDNPLGLPANASPTNPDNFDLDYIVDMEEAFEDSSSESSIATAVDSASHRPTRAELSAMRREYAVKRIFIRNRLVPVSVVREVKVLQYLRGNVHVIALLDVAPSGSSINLVFPLLPTNLTALIYAHTLNSGQVSLYGRMLAEGVAFLHENGIVHRDLKPSNLLVDWSGVLKICDFGQARAIDIGLEINGHRSELTYQVCTRWYRAPELLYGATSYGYDVDLWSVGCIIGEMVQEWPLYKGDSDIEQLSLVVKALGQPRGEWTQHLPDFNKIQFVHEEDDDSVPAGSYPRWLETLRLKSRSASNRCTDLVMDLLSRLCRYTERMTAAELVEHPFLNLDSVKENRDRLLVRAKCIKHMSGPRKNASGRDDKQQTDLRLQEK